MRFQPLLIAAISFCSLTCSLTPALAQTSDPTPPGSVELKSNYSSDSSDTAFGESGASGKRVHKGKHGLKAKSGTHRKGAMAAVRAIKALPSLTPEQSQKVDAVLTAFKQEMKPLRQQAQALRGQGKSASKAGPDSPAKAQLTEIKREFRSKAKEAMQKLLAILTPEQRTQLKSMRSSVAPVGQQG